MLERLHKILARSGVAALRPAEDMILAGRVTVNGRVVRELGARADPDTDIIAVDGQAIDIPEPSDPHRYIMLHKPRGVISTARDTHDRPTVLNLVPSDARLFPVGRLDADSEGLILLTDDGDLAYRLTHPRFNVEKEYRVLVDRTPELTELRRWRSGVTIPDGFATSSAWVEVLERTEEGAWLRVVMREGHKRQIREIAGVLGFKVLRLIRVREGPLALGDLAAGAWRPLSQQEVEALRTHTQHIPSREADQEREQRMEDESSDRPRRLRVIKRPRGRFDDAPAPGAEATSRPQGNFDAEDMTPRKRGRFDAEEQAEPGNRRDDPGQGGRPSRGMGQARNEGYRRDQPRDRDYTGRPPNRSQGAERGGQRSSGPRNGPSREQRPPDDRGYGRDRQGFGGQNESRDRRSGGSPTRGGSGSGSTRYGTGGGPPRSTGGRGPSRFGSGSSTRYGTGGGPPRSTDSRNPSRSGSGSSMRYGTGGGPPRSTGGRGPTRYGPTNQGGFGRGRDSRSGRRPDDAEINGNVRDDREERRGDRPAGRDTRGVGGPPRSFGRGSPGPRPDRGPQRERPPGSRPTGPSRGGGPGRRADEGFSRGQGSFGSGPPRGRGAGGPNAGARRGPGGPPRGPGGSGRGPNSERPAPRRPSRPRPERDDEE